MCNCVITSAFEFSRSLIDGCQEGRLIACLRGFLTAMGRHSITRLADCTNFRAEFQRKTWKTTAVSKNKQTKIETFIEICTGKDIKIRKRKTFRLFEQKAYSSKTCPVALPFCLELYQKRFYASKTPWLTRLCSWDNLVLTPWKHATKSLHRSQMRRRLTVVFGRATVDLN